MLNVYLVPRGRKAPLPQEAAIQSALDYLANAGIIGDAVDANEYAPGRSVGNLFPDVADQHLLPAEMTFEGFHVHQGRKPEFVPREQASYRFADAVCGNCGDAVDGDEFDDTFARLAFFPLDRVEYNCPACRSKVPFRDMDFGQTTSVARFWFRIEGIPFSKISPRLLTRLGKILGLSLLVVHEFVDEDAQDWIPALQSARW